MKRPIHLLSIGILAGALAGVPAVAQTGTDPNGSAAQSGAGAGSGSNPGVAANPNGSGTAAGSGQTVPGSDMNSPSRTDRNNDHGFNFGWLGLVGLAGLLGMRRNNANRYDDTRNINNTGPSGIR